MKKIILAAALLAAGTLCATAQTPAPALQWGTVRVTADANGGIDRVWDRIGGKDWCAISKYLDIQSCRIDNGTGDVGSARTINGQIFEVAVARTPYSYSYGQPLAQNFVHGTLGVEAIDAAHTRIVYTLIWNAAMVGDAKAQAAAVETRRARFQAAVDKMAAAADAP